MIFYILEGWYDFSKLGTDWNSRKNVFLFNGNGPHLQAEQVDEAEIGAREY
jgi:hypothetical protein